MCRWSHFVISNRRSMLLYFRSINILSFGSKKPNKWQTDILDFSKLANKFSLSNYKKIAKTDLLSNGNLYSIFLRMLIERLIKWRSVVYSRRASECDKKSPKRHNVCQFNMQRVTIQKKCFIFAGIQLLSSLEQRFWSNLIIKQNYSAICWN